jgi:anti-sigma regulatory factor (Ser/Thr protein kinase)
MSNLGRIEAPAAPHEWSLPLPATPAGPQLARHRVIEVLERWDLRCLRHAAALVTSELVGNVVHHGEFPAELRMSWEQRCVRLEVRDASRQLPRPRPSPADVPGGLGLEIVAGVAQAWGAVPTAHGKTVWAELAVE